MSYEVGVRAAFRASHALRGDFGPAREPHPHDYRVELEVRGARLRDDGTLCDITLLHQALADAIEELDGARLDALAPFRERNSTAEELARHVATRVRERVSRDGVERLVVRVWETEDAYAACEVSLS